MANDETLTRNTYRDPTTMGNPVRTGNVARSEAALDMDEYYRRLERVHSKNLHEYGVGSGLKITATSAAADLTVEPGIALDSFGQHISLAAGGKAEVNPNAKDPVTPQTTPVNVTTTGAIFPTGAVAAGNYYFTIEFLETFDNDAYLNLGIYRYFHTPWLRLQNAAPTDGSSVLLARVTIGASGHVTALENDARRGVGLPAEYLHLRRSMRHAGPPLSVDNVGYAEILPAGPNGGLSLRVPAPPSGAPAGSDVIDFKRTDGTNFTKMQIGAGVIAARASSGQETVVLNSELGNVVAGGHGVEGDVVVLDGPGNEMITLDASLALVVAGGQGKQGLVRVKDSERTDRVVLQGNGDIFFHHQLKDLDHPNLPGVNNAQLRELTNGSITTLHRHPHVPVSIGAHPFIQWMGTNGNDHGSPAHPDTVTAIIDVGTQRQLYASIVICSVGPTEIFDYDDGLVADIIDVDGTGPPNNGSWSGGHLGTMFSPFFVGTAQRLTFRLQNTNGCQVWALAAVIVEQ